MLASLAAPVRPLPPPSTALELIGGDDLEALRDALAEALEPEGDLDPRLAGVVRDTLATPGSLWRPQLAWAVGRAHGLERQRALELALGVECFHVASLLLDDLPAMDDSPSRRGRPAAHLVHGEGATILAALAFVHRGYRWLWAGLGAASTERRSAASDLVEECLGLRGILDGQARDLTLTERHRAPAAEVERAAAGKTVPLLRLALALPALAAGADATRIDELGRLAGHWGLAYQILDDLEDVGAPRAIGSADTDAGRGRPNLAGALGARGALLRLRSELARARIVVARIERDLGPLAALERLDARFSSMRQSVARGLARPRCA